MKRRRNRNVHNKQLSYKIYTEDGSKRRSNNTRIPVLIAKRTSGVATKPSGKDGRTSGYKISRSHQSGYDERKPVKNRATGAILPSVRFQANAVRKRNNMKILKGIDTLPTNMKFVPRAPAKEKLLNPYPVLPSISKPNLSLNPRQQYDDRQPVRKCGTDIIISEVSFVPTRLPKSKVVLTIEEKRRMKKLSPKKQMTAEDLPADSEIRKIIVSDTKPATRINIRKRLVQCSDLQNDLKFVPSPPRREVCQESASKYTVLPPIRKQSRPQYDGRRLVMKRGTGVAVSCGRRPALHHEKPKSLTSASQYNERKPVFIRGSDVILSDSHFIPKPGPEPVPEPAKLAPRISRKGFTADIKSYRNNNSEEPRKVRFYIILKLFYVIFTRTLFQG